MGIRHLILLMAFCVYVTAYITRIDLSTAIIAMTNTTGNYTVPRFDWDETLKSRLLSSTFFGYIFLQVPSGYLADMYSPKKVLTAALVVTGCCKLATPQITISVGPYGLYVLRIIEGMAQGCVIPGLAPLVGRWLPPKERTQSNQLMFGGITFGTLLGLLTAPTLLSTRFEWPLLFYSWGILAMVMTLAWVVLVADFPNEHRFISDEEKEYIEQALASVLSKKRSDLKVPWISILTSPPFLALIFTHAGRNWGYFTVFTQTPRYLSGVFHTDIRTAGYFSALNNAAACIAVLVFAIAATQLEKHEFFTLTVRRKIWNTMALWGQACMFFLMVVTSSKDITIYVVYLCIAAATNTAAYSGLLANQFDLSPNFGGILMGITTFCGSFAAYLGPYTVSFIIVDKSDVSEWNKVFMICAVIAFCANVVYLIFGSAEVQSWNKEKLR